MVELSFLDSHVGQLATFLRVSEVEVELAEVILFADVVVYFGVVTNQLRVGFDYTRDGDVLEKVRRPS